MRGRSGPASQVERAPPRRRSGRGRGWAAGRRARATAASSFAAGPSGVADGEAQVAQRAFVGVEAQDLGGGGGALQREAGAQRPGGGRVAAQDRRRAGRGRRRRRTGDRPALPFRSPAPRPGPAPAAERLAVPGLSPWLGFARARFAERRRQRARRGLRVGRRAGVRSARITGAW